MTLVSLSILSLLVLLNTINAEIIKCRGSCSCNMQISGQTCRLDCLDKDGCKDGNLYCRPGDPCIIQCYGENACSGNTYINGKYATNVNVICIGRDACKGNTKFECGTGKCDLSCEESSCVDMNTLGTNRASSFRCSPETNCKNTHSDFQPTNKPTAKPTPKPTVKPTPKPTVKPIQRPTIKPTPRPTKRATRKPSKYPTQNPTLYRTSYSLVSSRTTLEPLKINSIVSSTTTIEPLTINGAHSDLVDGVISNPTHTPTFNPTHTPTFNPTSVTVNPTMSISSPTTLPTPEPTPKPTKLPTSYPTNIHTDIILVTTASSTTNIPTTVTTASSTTDIPTTSITSTSPINIPVETTISTSSPTNIPIETSSTTMMPTVAPTEKYHTRNKSKDFDKDKYFFDFGHSETSTTSATSTTFATTDDISKEMPIDDINDSNDTTINKINDRETDVFDEYPGLKTGTIIGAIVVVLCAAALVAITCMMISEKEEDAAKEQLEFKQLEFNTQGQDSEELSVFESVSVEINV